MFILVFYVPATHLEKVKNALFKAGAGSIGNYSNCCWQVLGEGQFLPCSGSAPFAGKIGQLEKTAEYRVEIALKKELAEQVKKALLENHPYETPAYHFLNTVQIN